MPFARMGALLVGDYGRIATNMARTTKDDLRRLVARASLLYGTEYALQSSDRRWVFCRVGDHGSLYELSPWLPSGQIADWMRGFIRGHWERERSRSQSA